ncbi:hypothetical protein DEU56DRAFT_749298, partial [Suillus clintonianus]|uniref:uncharacterized protein n=1 Tax=Suillus clintonianus TaxID=1904413 RepID=UPI001B880F75
RSSTSVSLKVREVLILGQMTSYEERLIQMEAILKVSVSSSVYGESDTTNRQNNKFNVATLANNIFRAPSSEILRELSDSHYTVYDVLL